MENTKNLAIDYENLAQQIILQKNSIDLNIAQILRRAKITRQGWMDLINSSKGKNTETIGKIAKAMGMTEITLKIK